MCLTKGLTLRSPEPNGFVSRVQFKRRNTGGQCRLTLNFYKVLVEFLLAGERGTITRWPQSKNF